MGPVRVRSLVLCAVLAARAAGAQPATLPVEPGPFRAPDLVELTTLDPTIRLDVPVFETTTGAWVSWRAVRDAAVVGTTPPDGIAVVSGRLIVRCDQAERDALERRRDRDATIVHYDPARLPAAHDRAAAL